jgi:hypothetical protein
MSQFGKYKPDIAANSSSMFVFQEKPVASLKLNRWNGNIAAGFDLVHRVLALMLAQQQPAILTDGSQQALQVVSTEPASMQVAIQPGWAVFDDTLVGLEAQPMVPLGVEFNPPTSQDRIDLICITQYGEINSITGNEAPLPEAPATPEGSLALARVYQRPGATQILADDNSNDSYIIDQRPRLLLGEAHQHNGDKAPPENPDGIRIEFSTQHHFRANSLEVFVNGVLQQQGVDYSENVALNGYTFISPPLAHYQLQHRYVINHH